MTSSQAADGRATRQELTITNWHPTTSANRSHDHWRKIQRAHHADRDMAWASAMQAGWEFVPGKVLLTVVLVYPRLYRMDADNLAAKCKGLIDGLKAGHAPEGRKFIAGFGNVKGWFEDDDTEHLDLIVRAEVSKGVKETRLTLEAAA